MTNPRLLRYYSQELQHLREMGGEFAADYPKVAGRLGLEGLSAPIPTWNACSRALPSWRRAFR